MLMHIQLHDMAAHDMTLHGNTYDIHYIHDIHYIRDIHYIHYIHYRQYIQYMHDIQDIHDIHYRHIAFPDVSIHDTTRHDMTLLHILTYGSCAHGKGKGTEEKKAELCTFMLPEVTNTSSPRSLPSPHAGLSLACSVASLSIPQSLPARLS